MNKFLISVLISGLSLSMYGCSSNKKSSLSSEESLSKIEKLSVTSKKHKNVSDITHNNYHEENDETILLDKFGKKVSYEVLLTIDRTKEFGKNYILIYPSDSTHEDIELEAYYNIENEEGAEGELQQIETDTEWDMIEEVFNQFMDETW